MRVIEREGLVAALVSSAVSEERFVAACEASLGVENADDSNASRQRVNALRKALGDLHAECGAFAAVAFDVSAGRVLAARTANAAPLHYGFTQDGALVACGGLTARRLFPDAGDAALRLTPLPSGRFVFGHRFVKPIEFTRFWDTAAANRAAAPARDASSVLDAIERGANETVGAECARRRWSATGSAADGERRWTSVEQVPSVTPSTLHRAPSAGPSLRKKREAEAKAAAAKAKAKAVEKMEAPVSPRSAARAVERDAQVATALAAQDAVVLSLGDALVAAVAKTPSSAHISRPARRAGLRSNTFTLGRVPGAGAEKKTLLGVSARGKLRTASFRVEPLSSATKSSVSCAELEAEAGFASFKANFERMAAMRQTAA